MGVNYQHIKKYENFYGIDLKSNPLEFPDQYSTSAENVQFNAVGSIQKRSGYERTGKQPSSGIGPRYGLFRYPFTELSTESEQILGVGDYLYRSLKSYLSISYSGAESFVLFSLYYDLTTQQYICSIQAGATTVLTVSLGMGTETSPYTMGSLASAISALSGFSAAVSGDSSVPAAFIHSVPTVNILQNPNPYQGPYSDFDIYARYWTQVYTPAGYGAPFVSSASEEAASSFENASATILNRSLFIGHSLSNIMKYDGKSCYRAGLPPAADGSTGTFTITPTVTGAGTNYFVWRAQFVNIDANGISTEGNTFQSALLQNPQPSATSVALAITKIDPAPGFNTNCALISSTNTAGALTIPVTAGHTIQVGDTIYMWDDRTAPNGGQKYVTREVTGRTNTSIDVDATVGFTTSTTNNRNVISNNLRVRILRSKNTGSASVNPTLFYIVAEIPHNSIGTNNVFTDNNNDTALVTQFLEPVTDRSPPVKGAYLSQFQNLMITAGDPDNPNTVSVSDIESPEYFPVPSNQFIVSGSFSDKITAIHPTSEGFLVFQGRGISAVTGDVPNKNFRVDSITQDIGCASHSSIQDIRGTICFMSSTGPRAITGSSLPVGLGRTKENEFASRIDPLFLQQGLGPFQRFNLAKSIGFNDIQREKYYLFIPVLGEFGELKSNSVTLCYDYTRDAWTTYTNLNMLGGICAAESGNEIYFCERLLYTNAQNAYLNRFHNSGTYLDFQDNNQAIPLTYSSVWEFMGEANILKNFQRIRVYSVEQLDNSFDLTVATEKDFADQYYISEFVMPFGEDGYGEQEYSTSFYGDPAGPQQKFKLSNGRATSLRVNFENAQPQENVS